MTSTMLRAAALAFLTAGSAAAGTQAGPPTAAEAKAFADQADVQLLKASIEAQRADWVKSTFITDDTEAISARGQRAPGEPADRRWPSRRPASTGWTCRTTSGAGCCS